jgi:hypothetical protein
VHVPYDILKKKNTEMLQTKQKIGTFCRIFNTNHDEPLHIESYIDGNNHLLE